MTIEPKNPSTTIKRFILYLVTSLLLLFVFGMLAYDQGNLLLSTCKGELVGNIELGALNNPESCDKGMLQDAPFMSYFAYLPLLLFCGSLAKQFAFELIDSICPKNSIILNTGTKEQFTNKWKNELSEQLQFAANRGNGKSSGTELIVIAGILVFWVISYWSHWHPIETYGFDIWSSPSFPPALHLRAAFELFIYALVGYFAFRLIKIASVIRNCVKALVEEHQARLDLHYQTAIGGYCSNFTADVFKLVGMSWCLLIPLFAYAVFYPPTLQLALGFIIYAIIAASMYFMLTWPVTQIIQASVDEYWNEYKETESKEQPTATLLYQRRSISTFLGNVPRTPYNIPRITAIVSFLLSSGTIFLVGFKWVFYTFIFPVVAG